MIRLNWNRPPAASQRLDVITAYDRRRAKKKKRQAAHVITPIDKPAMTKEEFERIKARGFTF